MMKSIGWPFLSLLLINILLLVPACLANSSSAVLKQYRLIPDQEEWAERLYSDQDFTALENEVRRRLSLPINEEVAGEMERLYFELAFIPEEMSGGEVSKRKEILDRWVNVHADSHLPYLVRGNFLISAAWKIRGNKTVDKVDPKAWQPFYDQLQNAKIDLEKAWSLDPNDPNSAASLVTVAMGLGLSRSEMEVYYEKALTAYLGNVPAKIAKLFYLKPQWHGSESEMLMYAEEVKKKFADFPFSWIVLAYAKDEMRLRAKREEQPLSESMHAKTWSSISTIYKTLFNLYPDNLRVHFYAAYFAYRFKQYEAAAEQFDLIGFNWARHTVWDDLEDYNEARTKTYRRLGKKLFKQKKYKQGAEYYQKALETDPERGDNALQLSWYYGEIERNYPKVKHYANHALQTELSSDQRKAALAYIAAAERFS